MKPLETTVREVLHDAIAAEIESRQFLTKLAERAGTEEVRMRLLALADEEISHRAKLEKRYREAVGQQPPEVMAPTVELPVDLWDLDMRRALKIVLERERDAESNFRFMAERAQTGMLRSLFLELAEFEWKHKVAIQNEYDSFAEDPDAFFRDM
ncbi:MAG: ferritin family protein [Thermoanaerobaculia bacterium]